MGQMARKENLFTLRIRPGVYTGRRFVNNVSNFTPRNVRVSSKDILVFLYDGNSIFFTVASIMEGLGSPTTWGSIVAKKPGRILPNLRSASKKTVKILEIILISVHYCRVYWKFWKWKHMDHTKRLFWMRKYHCQLFYSLHTTATVSFFSCPAGRLDRKVARWKSEWMDGWMDGSLVFL